MAGRSPGRLTANPPETSSTSVMVSRRKAGLGGDEVAGELTEQEARLTQRQRDHHGKTTLQTAPQCHATERQEHSVVEGAGGGYDEVYSSRSFVLPENVETLFLSPTGSGENAWLSARLEIAITMRSSVTTWII